MLLLLLLLAAPLCNCVQPLLAIDQKILGMAALSCSVLFAVLVAVTVAAPMVYLGLMVVVVGVVLCGP